MIQVCRFGMDFFLWASVMVWQDSWLQDSDWRFGAEKQRFYQFWCPVYGFCFRPIPVWKDACTLSLSVKVTACFWSNQSRKDSIWFSEVCKHEERRSQLLTNISSKPDRPHLFEVNGHCPRFTQTGSLSATTAQPHVVTHPPRKFSRTSWTRPWAAGSWKASWRNEPNKSPAVSNSQSC